MDPIERVDLATRREIAQYLREVAELYRESDPDDERLQTVLEVCARDVESGDYLK